jgi:hypothetical protein
MRFVDNAASAQAIREVLQRTGSSLPALFCAASIGGTIDLDGLLHGLLSIGVEIQSSQVLSVWPALGANGDARITLPEFVDAMDIAGRAAMVQKNAVAHKYALVWRTAAKKRVTRKFRGGAVVQKYALRWRTATKMRLVVKAKPAANVAVEVAATRGLETVAKGAPAMGRRGAATGRRGSVDVRGRRNQQLSDAGVEEGDYLFIPERRRSADATGPTESPGFIPMLQDRYQMVKTGSSHDGGDHAYEEASVSSSGLLRREALQFHPKVVRGLLRLWRHVDCDRSGDLDLDEYTEMYRVLHTAVHNDCGEGAHRNDDCALYDEIGAQASKEYFEDARQGRCKIGKALFYKSLYQIADTWTCEISVKETCELLSRLHLTMLMNPSPKFKALQAKARIVRVWRAWRQRGAPRQREDSGDVDSAPDPLHSTIFSFAMTDEEEAEENARITAELAQLEHQRHTGTGTGTGGALQQGGGGGGGGGGAKVASAGAAKVGASGTGSADSARTGRGVGVGARNGGTVLVQPPWCWENASVVGGAGGSSSSRGASAGGGFDGQGRRAFSSLQQIQLSSAALQATNPRQPNQTPVRLLAARSALPQQSECHGGGGDQAFAEKASNGSFKSQLQAVSQITIEPFGEQSAGGRQSGWAWADGAAATAASYGAAKSTAAVTESTTVAVDCSMLPSQRCGDISADNWCEAGVGSVAERVRPLDGSASEPQQYRRLHLVGAAATAASYGAATSTAAVTESTTVAVDCSMLPSQQCGDISADNWCEAGGGSVAERVRPLDGSASAPQQYRRLHLVRPAFEVRVGQVERKRVLYVHDPQLGQWRGGGSAGAGVCRGPAQGKHGFLNSGGGRGGKTRSAGGSRGGGSSGGASSGASSGASISMSEGDWRKSARQRQKNLHRRLEVQQQASSAGTAAARCKNTPPRLLSARPDVRSPAAAASASPPAGGGRPPPPSTTNWTGTRATFGSYGTRAPSLGLPYSASAPSRTRMLGGSFNGSSPGSSTIMPMQPVVRHGLAIDRRDAAAAAATLDLSRLSPSAQTQRMESCC